MEQGKDKPTYEATHFIDTSCKGAADTLAALLNNASVFYVVEPMPDGIYRFYVKEEAFQTLVPVARLAERLDKV